MTDRRISLNNRRFATYAWIVLGYTVGVILWGAFVRATGSGAGCGSHWPLCNGELIPRSTQVETLIEFFHRVTSGLSGVLVLALWLWSFKAYPAGHAVRKGTTVAAAVILIESAIGAGLVKFSWVAHDDSVGRSVTIVVHLLNTFILLAVLALTAWRASGRGGSQIRWRTSLNGLLLLGVAGTMLVGASGALAALGDTLFPVETLAEGIRLDFSPAAHYLIRLRLLHPALSVGVGIYLLTLAGYLRVRTVGSNVIKLARLLTIVVLVQLAGGMLNVVLLAPVWMQIVHLFLAECVWIILVLTADEALVAHEKSASKTAPAPLTQIG